MQAPQGGNTNSDDQDLEDGYGFIFNRHTQTWEPPPEQRREFENRYGHNNPIPNINVPNEPGPHRCNPPQVRNPPVRPDNVYGHRNPVNIEWEIAIDQEWTRTVLGRGVPTTVVPPSEPMVKSGSNVPAPVEPQQEAPPITVPLPSMDEDENEMEDIMLNEDVDTMMMLGKHFILNYIMKQVAKPLKGIPYHYKDVKNYPLDEQKKWEQACKEEIKSIKDRNTWTLVDCPPDRKPIKCCWVFAKKLDGRFKACLVAKGFSQIYGEDYDETFSPVTRFETVWLLLAYACWNDWEIESLDVKTAFLYGQLNEEIYMEQPEGFKVPGSSNKVYCLLHALYGLKQATLAWNKELHKSLLKLNFKHSKSDPGVYIFQDKSGIMLFIVYIDDGLLMLNSAKLLKKKKTAFLNIWEAHNMVSHPCQLRHISSLLWHLSYQLQRLSYLLRHISYQLWHISY